MIRKAKASDLEAVTEIYRKIHDAEEAGIITTGWLREIYPTANTATAALDREDLYVQEENGRILGCGIINQIQVDAYEGAPWKNLVPDDQVCVLHTLVISPAEWGKGHAGEFLRFYEACAERLGCTELRIDTNARNIAARKMYAKRGYEEIAIVQTDFNGIPGISLVLLEKSLVKND